MPGRRCSDRLHQAVEAKEGVVVREETQTLATITIQNYFRMYEKLAGMTGTAETEETEFYQIYKLEVVVIPTNRPVRRVDKHDLVFKTRREKYTAVIEEIERVHKRGLPVLVGTVSVDVSETLARMLKRRGLSGRQGDPGQSIFFLSLEDDLMRLFGSDRIARWMDKTGATAFRCTTCGEHQDKQTEKCLHCGRTGTLVEESEVITHPWVTGAIGQAQKRVELQNFQARKRLLEYDDVMNQQREVIYSLRLFALEGGEELKGEALQMVEKAVSARIETILAEYESELDWDVDLLRQDLLMHYLLQVPEIETPDSRPTSLGAMQAAAVDAARKAFYKKLETLDAIRDESGQGYGDRLLALVMLNVLDEKWKDHLYDLDQLRNAIHYRSWGQKDPLIEYKQEAYTMFVDLMNDIYNTFTDRFLKVQLMFGPPGAQPPAPSDDDEGAGDGDGPGGRRTGRDRRKPAKRYNALGVLEDVADDDAEAE